MCHTLPSLASPDNTGGSCTQEYSLYTPHKFLGNGLGIVTMEKVSRRRKSKRRELEGFSGGKAVDVLFAFLLIREKPDNTLIFCHNQEEIKYQHRLTAFKTE